MFLRWKHLTLKTKVAWPTAIVLITLRYAAERDDAPITFRTFLEGWLPCKSLRARRSPSEPRHHLLRGCDGESVEVPLPLFIPSHTCLPHSPEVHPGDTGHSPDTRTISSFSPDHPQGNCVGWEHPVVLCRASCNP